MENEKMGDQLSLKPDTLTGMSAVRHHKGEHKGEHMKREHMDNPELKELYKEHDALHAEYKKTKHPETKKHMDEIKKDIQDVLHELKSAPAPAAKSGFAGKFEGHEDTDYYSAADATPSATHTHKMHIHVGSLIAGAAIGVALLLASQKYHWFKKA